MGPFAITRGNRARGGVPSSAPRHSQGGGWLSGGASRRSSAARHGAACGRVGFPASRRGGSARTPSPRFPSARARPVRATQGSRAAARAGRNEERTRTRGAHRARRGESGRARAKTCGRSIRLSTARPSRVMTVRTAAARHAANPANTPPRRPSSRPANTASGGGGLPNSASARPPGRRPQSWALATSRGERSSPAG